MENKILYGVEVRKYGVSKLQEFEVLKETDSFYKTRNMSIRKYHVDTDDIYWNYLNEGWIFSFNKKEVEKRLKTHLERVSKTVEETIKQLQEEK